MKQKKILIGNNLIKVDIANTDQKRSLGLSGRDKLEENSGMLFVYNKKDIYAFWMKGMRFNLDFIWIADSKVAELTENVPVENKPENELTIYKPKKAVDKILEVNAGFVKKHKVKIGDSLEILN